MRRFIFVGVAVVLLALGLSGVASAQQYPSVANLKPFTAESDYMSLPGYLRYLVYQQSSQWVTYDEATRIVKQQQGG